MLHSVLQELSQQRKNERLCFIQLNHVGKKMSFLFCINFMSPQGDILRNTHCRLPIMQFELRHKGEKRHLKVWLIAARYYAMPFNTRGKMFYSNTDVFLWASSIPMSKVLGSCSTAMEMTQLIKCDIKTHLYKISCSDDYIFRDLFPFCLELAASFPFWLTQSIS